MEKIRLTRRTLLATGTALCVPGCQNPVLSNAVRVARYTAFGYPDLPLQRTAVAKLPYATMTARVGRGPQALLVLGRIEGRDRHWISADRAVLVTRGGRVVRTFGFPENLKATISLGEDPVDGHLHELEGEVTCSRTIDLDLSRLYGVVIDSRFRVIGRETIRIVEIDFDVIRVEEVNEARYLNWRFVNQYWVDPGDGFVWQSRQHIARTFPPVEYQILKPAG